jgi:hypothetical protein
MSQEINASMSWGAPAPAHAPRIIPSVFSQEMLALWHERGCADVEGMPAEWLRILSVFQDALTDNYYRRGPTTRAYAGQLGLGKSQAAQVALAALAAQYHLGIHNQAQQGVGGILVVERKATADQAVATINRSYRRISGRNDDCATTKHSGNDVSFHDLETFPILVITHEAYKISLNKLVEKKRSTWNSYVGYAYGKRLLTIVDEAFNPVHDYSVTSADVKMLLAMVSEVDPHLNRRLITEAGIIYKIYDALVAQEQQVEEGTTVLDTTDTLNALRDEDYSLDFLYQTLLDKDALRTIAWCRPERGVKLADKALQIRERVAKTLSSLDRLLNQWSYFAKYDRRKSFNSARWLLPDDVGNLVILDGTAHVNDVYTLLFGEDITIMRPNDTLRDYSPVTLSFCHTQTGLGREALLGVKKGKVVDESQTTRRAEALLDWCKEHIDTDKKVLICTHKDAAEAFNDIHDGTFADWQVTWWGNTTGSNAWSDFDVAITTSIFRKPMTWAGSAIAARYGLGDGLTAMEDQTNQGKLRRLIMSDAAAEIIQFLGRVKARRPIDNKGRCSPCQLYVMLGRDAAGVTDGQYQRMRSSIEEAFPGAKVREWGIKVVKQGRPAKTREISDKARAVVSFFDSKTGTITREDVLDFLGITTAEWRAGWRQLLCSDTCKPCQVITKQGWVRCSSGTGRWQKTWWEKGS